jgi:hypothetical protein
LTISRPATSAAHDKPRGYEPATNHTSRAWPPPRRRSCGRHRRPKGGERGSRDDGPWTELDGEAVHRELEDGVRTVGVGLGVRDRRVDKRNVPCVAAQPGLAHKERVGRRIRDEARLAEGGEDVEVARVDRERRHRGELPWRRHAKCTRTVQLESARGRMCALEPRRTCANCDSGGALTSLTARRGAVCREA